MYSVLFPCPRTSTKIAELATQEPRSPRTRHPPAQQGQPHDDGDRDGVRRQHRVRHDGDDGTDQQRSDRLEGLPHRPCERARRGDDGAERCVVGEVRPRRRREVAHDPREGRRDRAPGRERPARVQQPGAPEPATQVARRRHARASSGSGRSPACLGRRGGAVHEVRWCMGPFRPAGRRPPAGTERLGRRERDARRGVPLDLETPLTCRDALGTASGSTLPSGHPLATAAVQRLVYPASTCSVVPVTYDERSETSHRLAWAISRG